jgi:hypothetical protein
MPGIHDNVMSLIARLYTLHTAGAGTLSVLDIADLFGLALDQLQRSEISQRSTISFTKTSDNGGNFENDGTAITFKQNLLTVSVPPEVMGTYLSFPNSLTLLFSAENTIAGGALFFKATLQELDANQYKLDVDFSSDALDQCIIHAA